MPSHLYALWWGMKNMPEVGRIHSAIPQNGIMTSSRFHLPGPTHCDGRISIGLLTAQYVKGRLGQMPGHGADGLAVALARPQIGRASCRERV